MVLRDIETIFHIPQVGRLPIFQDDFCLRIRNCCLRSSAYYLILVLFLFILLFSLLQEIFEFFFSINI